VDAGVALGIGLQPFATIQALGPPVKAFWTICTGCGLLGLHAAALG